MDSLTRHRLGKTVTINDQNYMAIESSLLAEMGPVVGEGISLVVFDEHYRPSRRDQVVFNGQIYAVSRHQMFNGKPLIWIE